MSKVHYTKEQKAAVAHRKGNLLIIACAGSGKTEVISRRVAELVNHKKEPVGKGEIVAFTFTDRAARELKARIRGHLEDMDPEDPSLGDMYVGTIHSFCLKLLRDLDSQYRNFEVMEEDRQVAFIAANFHQSPDGKLGIGLHRLRDRMQAGYWETIRSFLSTLNVMHQKGIRLEDLKDPVLKDVVSRYMEVTRGKPNYFFDFNGIIDELISYLRENPDQLKSVRDRFRYLIVDEYQDVDARQEELIQLLSDKGRKMWVTAVGDDDQAIYGWRGADVTNILSFEKIYPQVTSIKLENNFRSTHVVVELANKAIRVIEERLDKNMVGRHPLTREAEKPRERMAESGDVHKLTFASDTEEAVWVSERVKSLRGVIVDEKDGTKRAIDYSDMAILLRSVKSSGRVFVEELRRQGIPVVVKGTGGLFGQEEVLLIQAAFCLLARVEFYFGDEDGPHRFTPEETREFIREKANNLKANGAMPKANGVKFLEWLSERRAKLDLQNLPKNERGGGVSRRIYPQEIFQEMLQNLGAGAGPDPWPTVVLFNLGRLSGLLTAFETVHQWMTPGDLVGLCFFLGGWAAHKTDEGGIDEISAPNAVQVMTVHAAKGLEWPVVFLPRISTALFPSSRRTRGPETFLDPDIFDPAEYAGGDDGERRLWYVALTRCRKFLHVTSQSRPRKKPTEYFKEIKHEMVRTDGRDPLVRPKGEPHQPANSELLPTTFSDLNYFWGCNFEYQLRSLMGFKPGVKESYGYGQQIHNILAEVHKRLKKGKKVSEDDLSKLVQERFNLRYTSKEPLRILRDAAEKCLVRYVKEFGNRGDLMLESEKNFEYMDKESGALITGTIDLLEEIEVGPGAKTKSKPVCVIDFKTHNWKDMEEFNKRKAEVERQLRIYAAAVKNALGFDPRSALAHFLSPKPLPSDLVRKGASATVSVDVSVEQQDKVRLEVKEAVIKIKNGIVKERLFQRTGCKTGRCVGCDFRIICPGYKEWRKKDKSTPHPPSYSEEREIEFNTIERELDAGTSAKRR